MTNDDSGNGWYPMKTRLRKDERDWVEKTAQADMRSIAAVLRRLVRESMARSEQEEAA